MRLWYFNLKESFSQLEVRGKRDVYGRDRIPQKMI